MNPVIGQFRPAPVRLDTVAQTQRKKTERTEQQNAVQTAQIAQTAHAQIPNRPAAEYTPGVQPVSAGEYRVGQDEDGNRQVYVDPVTKMAMSVAEKAEDAEGSGKPVIEKPELSETDEGAPERAKMSDLIGDVAENPQAAREEIENSAGTIAPAQEEEETEAADIFGNGTAAQAQMAEALKPSVPEPEVDDGTEPAVRRPDPSDRPVVRRPDPSDRVRSVVKTDEDSFDPIEAAAKKREKADEIEDAVRERQAADKIEGVAQRRKAEDQNKVETAEALKAKDAEEIEDGAQQPKAAEPIGTGQQKPQAVEPIGTGRQEPQAVEPIGTGQRQPKAVEPIGTGQRQPQRVDGIGAADKKAQAANAIGNAERKAQAAEEIGAPKSENPVQKAEKAEKAKKAEQAEQAKKDEQAEQAAKAEKDKQAKKDEQAEKTRKTEEVKRKRTAAANQIKQDIKRLKTRIEHERNPKRAEELSVQLLQMNAKLRQVNPGEAVTLAFK